MICVEACSKSGRKISYAILLLFFLGYVCCYPSSYHTKLYVKSTCMYAESIPREHQLNNSVCVDPVYSIVIARTKKKSENIITLFAGYLY